MRIEESRAAEGVQEHLSNTRLFGTVLLMHFLYVFDTYPHINTHTFLIISNYEKTKGLTDSNNIIHGTLI